MNSLKEKITKLKSEIDGYLFKLAYAHKLTQDEIISIKSMIETKKHQLKEIRGY